MEYGKAMKGTIMPLRTADPRQGDTIDRLSGMTEVGRTDAVETEPRSSDSWLSENREALAGSNAYVEAHGLPLARYRCF